MARSAWLLSCLVTTSLWPVSVDLLAQNERLPVPDRAEQARLIPEIEEVYSVSELSSPAEKTRVAGQLSKVAEQSNDLERFVLWRTALDLATQAGDIGLALKSCDQLAARYEMSVDDLKMYALARTAGNVRGDTKLQAFFQSARALLTDLSGKGHVEWSASFADRLYAICRNLPDAEQRREARDLRLQLQGQLREEQAHASALDKLKLAPADPDANRVVGLRLWTRLGDWQKGAEHLTHTNDASLQSLAKGELSPPAEPLGQMKLANLWYGQGQTKAENVRFLTRAYYWYSAAAHSDNNLLKNRAQLRVKEIADRFRKERINYPLEPWKSAAELAAADGNPDVAAGPMPEPRTPPFPQPPAPTPAAPTDETLANNIQNGPVVTVAGGKQIPGLPLPKGVRILAQDIHTAGVNNGNPRGVTYALTTEHPVDLAKTAVAVFAYQNSNGTNGQILVSIEGAGWSKFGGWSRSGTFKRNLAGGRWKVMPLTKYAGQSAKNIRVKFDKTGDLGKSLIVENVMWLYQERN